MAMQYLEIQARPRNSGSPRMIPFKKELPFVKLCLIALDVSFVCFKDL